MRMLFRLEDLPEVLTKDSSGFSARLDDTINLIEYGTYRLFERFGSIIFCQVIRHPSLHR
jgi:hypothetical protein